MNQLASSCAHRTVTGVNDAHRATHRQQSPFFLPLKTTNLQESKPSFQLLYWKHLYTKKLHSFNDADGCVNRVLGVLQLCHKPPLHSREPRLREHSNHLCIQASHLHHVGHVGVRAVDRTTCPARGGTAEGGAVGGGAIRGGAVGGGAIRGGAARATVKWRGSRGAFKWRGSRGRGSSGEGQ